VPTLFTALTVGKAAENPVVYGQNSNSFVVKGGDLVEVVINNFDAGFHPMHIHGHAVQLVARAPGVFTPPSPGKSHHNHGHSGHMSTHPGDMGFNGDTTKMPRIPMRRDTWMVAGLGYTVIRFIADNPGVWFLHCHMEWHMEAGLIMTIVEDPLKLQKTQKIPDAWKEQCLSQGFLIEGNAAGNTKNFTDLTGANTVCPPLPIT
jgi:iron transport multicopper oxidase